MLVEVPVQIRAAALGHRNVPFFYIRSRHWSAVGGIFIPGGNTVLQSCQYCGRMHPVGFTCTRKPQKRRKNTEAQRFRDSYQWRKTRKNVNDRDGHMCRICLLAGEIVIEGLSTHHIIPLEETMDYADVEEWCITLCEPHHEEAERGDFDREMLHRLAMEPLALENGQQAGI